MNSPMHVVCPHCHTTNRLPSERLSAAPKCGKCKQDLFAAHPIELTQANFQQHIGNGDLPVVVDFWAPWCGPCRMMAPVFEQAAAQLEPQVRLAKLNTEDQPQLAARYAIRSIPTLAIFKHGREVARISGAMDLGRLRAWIDSHR